MWTRCPIARNDGTIAPTWGPDRQGFATPAEAAEEVRQAIIAGGGGRENGRAVEPLVAADDYTFYIPISETSRVDADGLIKIESVADGGFLASFASFCAGTFPDPFPWGLEEVADAG